MYTGKKLMYILVLGGMDGGIIVGVGGGIIVGVVPVESPCVTVRR